MSFPREKPGVAPGFLLLPGGSEHAQFQNNPAINAFLSLTR
jgi:hypothetical protein